MKKTKIIINSLLCLLLLSNINNAHSEPSNLAIKKLDKRFDTKHWDYKIPVTSTEKTSPTMFPA